jgi:hypothetical protein
MKDIPDIKANFNLLYFQNGNGVDLIFIRPLLSRIRPKKSLQL